MLIMEVATTHQTIQFGQILELLMKLLEYSIIIVLLGLMPQVMELLRMSGTHGDIQIQQHIQHIE